MNEKQITNPYTKEQSIKQKVRDKFQQKTLEATNIFNDCINLIMKQKQDIKREIIHIFMFPNLITEANIQLYWNYEQWDDFNNPIDLHSEFWMRGGLWKRTLELGIQKAIRTKSVEPFKTALEGVRERIKKTQRKIKKQQQDLGGQ